MKQWIVPTLIFCWANFSFTVESFSPFSHLSRQYPPTSLQFSKSPHPRSSSLPPKSTKARTNHYKLNQELQKLKKRSTKIAERRLLEAVAESQLHPDHISVNDVSFNIVLHGYSLLASRHSYDATAPRQAEALFRKMTNEFGIPPTGYTYNAILQTWANSRHHQATSAILGWMQAMEEAGLAPDTFTYNMLIQSNLINADEWMQVMKDKGIPPNRQTYNLLFKSYAIKGNAEEAETLFEDLVLLSRSQEMNNGGNGSGGVEELRPHNVWINSIIQAWNKSGSPKAGKKADRWLERMQKMYMLGQTNMRPDATTYSHLMNVHSSLGNTQRVQSLLEDLEHRYKLTQEPEMQPDTVTYTTAIKAYSNQPEEASKLLQRMLDLTAAGRRNVAPNIVTYSTVVRIWASTRTREGLQKATEILDTMLVEPNSNIYAELIFGWSSSGLREGGYRAQQLLEELEALPASQLRGLEIVRIYNAVMAAWNRSGDSQAPKRAEELLHVLERKHQQGDWKACPTIVTFLTVADAYAKASISDALERCDRLLERMNRLGIAPTRVFYNSILNALAKSCQPHALARAEAILTMMETSGDPELRPDIVTYSTIIDCYTKSGQSSARAEEILELVEDTYNRTHDKALEPNPVFYSAMLQSWAKSSSAEGVEKAEALLRRNEELYNRGEGYGHCKPHAILYNAVIDAVARSGKPGAGRQAETLLQEMEDLYQAGADEAFRPSRRSLNAVMLAYRSEVDGGSKAEYILGRMEELTAMGVYDVMPDVVAFNTAIGAIAGSNEANAANRSQALLERMEELYAGGHESVRPDGLTYAMCIEAWLKRQDDTGQRMAHQLSEKFFSLVNNNQDNFLVTALVLNVIQAYREDDNDDDDCDIAGDDTEWIDR